MDQVRAIVSWVVTGVLTLGLATGIVIKSRPSPVAPSSAVSVTGRRPATHVKTARHSSVAATTHAPASVVPVAVVAASPAPVTVSSPPRSDDGSGGRTYSGGSDDGSSGGSSTTPGGDD